MISCTEFIPAYSELFTWMETEYGREAVENFLAHLFRPSEKGLPLASIVEEEGIRGCFTYWAKSLNEEAADFTMYLNEKRGFFFLEMHQCPSKGRLLRLRDEIGIVPYHEYCLHCDNYRASVEQAGFQYIYNFSGTDSAACSVLIYDPRVFDGRVIVDADTQIMDRKAYDNEYFHQEFHFSMNASIDYVGERYGTEGVIAYLTQYTKSVHKKLLEDCEKQGLKALQRMICNTYRKEKAEDAIETVLSEKRDCLQIRINYCPAVRYLKETGREVSKWFRYTTEIVMETLAEAAGYHFVVDAYDEKTGAAAYRFMTENEL